MSCKGSQACSYDCQLPIALRTVDNRRVNGSFTTPTLNDETGLPALLGLKTLMDKRAIIDFRNLQITFCGPEELPMQFPPGSDTFQLLQAPSGHLMLPCCEYDFTRARNVENGLVLVTEPVPH